MSEPGARLSLLDVALLGIAAATVYWMSPRAPQFAGLIAIVVAHFFLFCNVFRVRTHLEIKWALALLLNATVWMAGGRYEHLARNVLLIQMPITIYVIVQEIRSTDYRGIGARRREHAS